MKVHYLLISFIFILLGFSCKRSRPEIEVISLTSDLEIDMLSDSTFFKNINCIVEYGGDIYMSMDQRMQIARMDSDLKLKNTIGRAGRGPGEFTYLNNFSVAGDEVWIGDETKSAFVKYTPDGRFISNVEKGEKRSDSDFRFWLLDGKIYFSRPDIDKRTSLAVLGVDENGEGDYIQFGDLKDFEASSKTSMQNGRHVFLYGNDIIAVPGSIPIIERYDKNSLKLKDIFDVTTIPEIDKVYNNVLNNRDLSNPQSIFIMVNDAFLHDDMLYILYPTPISMDENSKSNKISALAFDIGDDEIEYVKHYTFSGDNLLKICVTDDYIYGAPYGSGLLKRYPLK